MKSGFCTRGNLQGREARVCGHLYAEEEVIVQVLVVLICHAAQPCAWDQGSSGRQQ